MKKLFFVFVMICGFSSIWAQEYTYKQNIRDKTRIDIYNERGTLVGYTKPNKLKPGETILYDHMGRRLQIIKTDASGNTSTYNLKGQQKGVIYSPRNNSDRVDIVDKYGKVIGYKKPNSFDKNRIDHYDNLGRLQGYWKKKYYSNDWQYYSK